MNAATLTHKDIARALDIAEATVKSYRRAFPEFFELIHQGKPLRYAPSALEVCRVIRDGRQESLSEVDIRHRLREIMPELNKAGANDPRELGGARRDASAEAVPAMGAELLERYENALAQTAEVQSRLVRLHEESAAQMEQMQRRMSEALTMLEDRAGQQDTMIEALTRRQHEILDGLAAIQARVAWEETAMPVDQEQPEDGSDTSENAVRSRVTRVAVRNAYGDVQRYTLATGEPDVQTSDKATEAGPPAAAAEQEQRQEGPPPASPGDANASAPADIPDQAEEDAARRPQASEDEEMEMEEEPTSATEKGEQAAESMAMDAEAGAHPLPPRDYRELPLVVRSEMGEYLGVGGKNLGAFSLEDLTALVDRTFTPPANMPFEVRYAPASEAVGASGPAWTLRLDQSTGQSYRLELERTTTPRGNDVVVLSALYVDGQDVPPANLYLFIKQMLQLAGE
ncbi:hypothetical protein [Oceanidesulfovibrio marinus]|uniref:HTH merR-type domain-containing protein n=1 Tax=Oceanidesulfovibrio marinus TaxID=370038 RepID=A0A6P1ZL34_9BACT|nr:hypothetical protein [Oceanidesulfovibrio marinus]QJT10081.1 hypothetical protein E8L03_14595 [Oceanidesulfovibrio marinus]TVM35804.1 hypothetical protein DQK91_03845 [Oceanidesulfovibrio marinus]